MSAMASQITSVSIVCWIVSSGAGQRIHQSSLSLTIVRRNHCWPMDSTHKGPVKRKIFPFDDVIMQCSYLRSHFWVTPHEAVSGLSSIYRCDNSSNVICMNRSYMLSSGRLFNVVFVIQSTSIALFRNFSGLWLIKLPRYLVTLLVNWSLIDENLGFHWNIAWS